MVGGGFHAAPPRGPPAAAPTAPRGTDAYWARAPHPTVEGAWRYVNEATGETSDDPPPALGRRRGP